MLIDMTETSEGAPWGIDSRDAFVVARERVIRL
jgi:hypothetical protein